MKNDIDSHKLTLDDILVCSESEQKKMLGDEYQISVVQTNRFIKAIKELSTSKMNEEG